MTFNLNNLKFNSPSVGTSASKSTASKSTISTEPLAEPAKPSTDQAAKPEATSSTTSSADEFVPSEIKIEGEELLGDLPVASASFKDQLAEVPSLDELAREFQNSDQPDAFDDAALAAVHKACLALEQSIDNETEVREQLTFIMNELRKYPETAAKVYDSDIAVMVRALRQNYRVVAFAKQANKKAKAEKQSKVQEMLAEAEAGGLFDGLDL